MKDVLALILIMLKPTKKIFALTVGIVLLCLALVFIYSTYVATQANQLAGAERQQNDGIDATPGVEQLSGALYFSADVQGDADYVPDVYTYDFESTSVRYVVDVSAVSFSRGIDTFDIMVAYHEGTEDPDYYQPSWHSPETGDFGILPHVNGYNETDLTASPDNTHYAYSYQTSAAGNSRLLDDRNIAIHNFETGSVARIPAASEPEWIREGDYLVYMKQDGLYLYSLATEVSIRIFDRYTNLGFQDDIAVVPGEDTIILTSPSAHIIFLLDLQGEIVVERSIIYTPDTRYRHPVVSPDGQYYAVMAAQDALYDEESKTYDRIDVEIRSFESPDVIDTISFLEFTSESISLEDWLD